MKIKLLDRILLFLGAVLAILTGAALIVTGLQFTGVFAENVPLWVKIVCIAAGALLMAYGAYVISVPHRYSAKHKEFVVQRTDSGELRIAVKAIENLVQKCVDLHEEIHLERMEIINGREGVVVDLNISLANNISIPLAVASLQKQIKQYLVASSGIEVKEVRVSVESTQDEPEVMEEIKDEEAAQERVSVKEPKEKKAPLHQRLFGKPDQPAIVPEPPKAEPEAPAEPEPEAEAPAEEEGTPAEEEIPAEPSAEEAVQEAAETIEDAAEQLAEEQPLQDIAQDAANDAEEALNEVKDAVQELIPGDDEILPEPEEEKHETEEPSLE
ncbi:MAG: alkaline shock response membrane anchor protein AmaP [Clostridia bacterium]|nr:alkaline shock response membrane anchor protein AmaP [Clostridia bacterium]